MLSLILKKHFVFYLGLSLLLFSIGNINSGIPIWGNTLRFVGVFLFFFILLANINPPKKNITSVIVIFLFICFFFTITRNFSINIEYIKSILSNPYIFLPFTFPLVYFLKVNQRNIKHIFKIIIVFNIIFIFLFIINMANLHYTDLDLLKADGLATGSSITEALCKNFALVNGFLLLNYKINNSKVNLLVIVVFLLSLYIAVIFARRNIIFTLIIFLIFSITHNNYKTTFKYLILTIISVLILIYFNFIDNIFDFINSNLPLLSERFNQDTRSNVISNFFYGLSTFDLIFGKGINGTYYVPDFCDGNNNRNIIEAGYLFIILKSGIIGLSLYLFILIRSIFLGLFRSRNFFVRNCSLYLMVSLLDIYPSGVPMFDIRFFVMWICILVCNNRLFLLADNEYIKKFYINLK